MEANNSIANLFLAGAAAACIAEGVTLPLDTAKVRLQLQSFAPTKGQGSVVPLYSSSPLHALRVIAKNEGVLGLFKGLVPGLHRQFIFTGLRLSMYEEMKAMIGTKGGSDDESITTKVVAALAVSAVGISLANPSDVVKVRFQANKGALDSNQNGATWKAYRSIAAQEGIRGGLYKGFFPNLLRNCVISTTEIVTYDVAKHALIDTFQFEEGLPTHLAAAISAGFAATCMGSPADVVGTRIMTDRSSNRLGLLPYVAKMVKEEGLASLWKGFLPNFARIGSFNIVLWLSFEHLKSIQ